MQKKKITRNYQLPSKVETGKCRRVTAAINWHHLSQQGRNPNECTNRKTTFYFSQMMLTSKEKLPRPPHPFGRSVICVMESLEDASGQRSFLKNLIQCFLFGRESFMATFPFEENGIIGITVVPEDKEHLVFNFVTFVNLFAHVSPVPTLLSSRACQVGKKALNLQFCKPIFPSKKPFVIIRFRIAHMHWYLFCGNFLSSLLPYVKLLWLTWLKLQFVHNFGPIPI